MRQIETVVGFVDLPAKRARVLQAVVVGTPISKVASDLGIARSTVHRWIRDPDFVSALEQTRVEMATVARGQLLGLVGSAIESVRVAIEESDDLGLRVRTSLEVLKGLRLFGPATEPEDKEASADLSSLPTSELLRRRQEILERLHEFGLGGKLTGDSRT